MRAAHWLRPNMRSELPSHLVVFDTETDSNPLNPDLDELRLRFGWAAYYRRHRGDQWTPPRWHRFTTGRSLWRWVTRITGERKRTLMVAHNLGFDLRTTDAFTILPALGWELRAAVLDDPPTILRYKRGRHGLLLADSLNWYRVPLRVIGEELGLPKLDFPTTADDPELWDIYCRRDVEIVAAAMRSMIDRVGRWDLGNFASTLPGQAFGAWRHRHLSHPVLIDADERALTLARDAYHGGRTECFRIGAVPGPVAYFDVNSMYPSVMREQPMPTVLRGVYTRVTPRELLDMLASGCAVADVTLSTPTPDYPLVWDGRLIFPVGTFRAPLTTPELTHALTRGRVKMVHRVALYDAAPIFTSYVDEWWARRRDAQREGNRTDAYVAKLMLNSLYGKLGQHGRRWEGDGPVDPAWVRSWIEVDADTGQVFRRRAVGGLLQYLRTEGESRDSHPAIAAHVTAAARMSLLSMMEQTGRAFVVYVDTDSLMVAPGAPGPPQRLLAASRLGALKRVDTFVSLTLHAPKDYSADGHRVTKGIRADAEQVASGVYVQDHFEGLSGAIAGGRLSGVRVARVRKVLHRDYRKGVVLPDGRVLPIRFSSPGVLAPASESPSGGTP